MRVGSLFSGIGGLDLGLERAGMEVRWQVEIHPFRRSVLQQHWNVPLYDDIRTVDLRHVPLVDLICGGFPCQDVSIAGKRAGLEGKESSLWWEFHRFLDAIRPRWCLVENVPGLLSSHKGRDFALVLASLVEIGYGVTWRVLDSRYFGVPQRRRRVFIVGYLGAESTKPFLAFLESGDRDSKKSRKKGKEVAGTLGGGSGGRGWTDDLDRSGAFIPYRKSRRPRDNQDDETWINDGVANTLNPFDQGETRSTHTVVRMREGKAGGGKGPLITENQSFTLQSFNDQTIFAPDAVRRLTPVEWCRLQGFPDDWLGAPNEPPDSAKYAALGDAVTVNVAHWIGERIMASEN